MSEQNQMPTPEMVEAMMRENFGKLPSSMESVKKFVPSFFYRTSNWFKNEH